MNTQCSVDYCSGRVALPMGTQSHVMLYELREEQAVSEPKTVMQKIDEDCDSAAHMFVCVHALHACSCVFMHLCDCCFATA